MKFLKMLKEVLKERIKQPKGCVKVGKVSGTFFTLIIYSVLMGSLAGLNLQFILPGVIRLTSALSHLRESLSTGPVPEQEAVMGVE